MVAHNADELFDGCNPFLGHVTHLGRQAKIRICTGNIPKHKFGKGHGLDCRVALHWRTTEWVVYRLRAGNRATLDGARDLNSFVNKHPFFILRIV